MTVRCGRIVKSFARSSRDDAAETGRCASTTSSWRRVSFGLDVAGSLASCAGRGSLASGGRVSSAARVPATIDSETTAATSAASRDLVAVRPTWLGRERMAAVSHHYGCHPRVGCDG